MKAKHLFAVMCVVMMGMSVATNNKEEVKKADADVVEKSLTIFENGSFTKEVDSFGANGAITDGIFCNDGSGNASRVLLKEAFDLSTYKNLAITYSISDSTNDGKSPWAQFGIANVKQYGEFDYVAKDLVLTENKTIISISNLASASITCTWGKTHDSLDMTNIKGFCIKSNAVVSVSKVVATKLELSLSKEFNILKDGNFYSDYYDPTFSSIEDGLWKNDGSYNHSRILFKNSIDLSAYETIEITYIAITSVTGWTPSVEFGIGNNPSSTDYHYVAIKKDVDLTGNESTVTLNIADYLSTKVSCSWANASHAESYVDITKFAGISAKAGNITLTISSIVAKSSLLTFVDELNAFKLCDATVEQIQAMIEEYNLVLDKNPNASNYQLDENTTLAQRMDYMEMILNKKVADSNKTVGSGVVIQTNKTDKESLIALIAILGIISVSAYYFIEKRKISNK